MLSDELAIERHGSGILVVGRVECEAGIYLDITESWAVNGSGPSAMVERRQYSYNAALRGRGNIFRYNSPHQDHNFEHHVHHFDVLGGDTSGGDPIPIYSVDQTPTLYEAIGEAERWYVTHVEELIQQPREKALDG